MGRNDCWRSLEDSLANSGSELWRCVLGEFDDLTFAARGLDARGWMPEIFNSKLFGCLQELTNLRDEDTVKGGHELITSQEEFGIWLERMSK